MRDVEDENRVTVSGEHLLEDVTSSPVHRTSIRLRTDESSSTASSLSGQVHDADFDDPETVVAALSHPDLSMESSSEPSSVLSMEFTNSVPSGNNTPGKYREDDSLVRSSRLTTVSPSGLSTSAPPSSPVLPIPPHTCHPRGTISRGLG